MSCHVCMTSRRWIPLTRLRNLFASLAKLGLRYISDFPLTPHLSSYHTLLCAYASGRFDYRGQDANTHVPHKSVLQMLCGTAKIPLNTSREYPYCTGSTTLRNQHHLQDPAKRTSTRTELFRTPPRLRLHCHSSAPRSS